MGCALALRGGGPGLTSQKSRCLKCNGCGYCECKCPATGESAIIVEPSGELRFASGSYKEKARESRLVFHAKDRVEDHTILNRDQREGKELPEGPAVKDDKKLPPGFITN